MITISFQTQFLPAPFAHAYVLKLKKEGSLMSYDFELEYLDRDHLTEEDIMIEGAEPEAYLSFQGKLNGQWSDILISEIEHIDLIEDQPEHKDYLYFEIENSSGFAKNADDWFYLMQELIQCIYELNHKEYPLEIELRVNSENSENFLLTGSFSERKFTINKKEHPWEKLRDTLAFFENFELSESPVEKVPEKKGIYINYGDGVYFKVKKIKNESELPLMIALLYEKIA